MKTKTNIQIGELFCTPSEHGCKVVTLPDENGDFLAGDSDGVICVFNTEMVVKLSDCKAEI